MLSNKNIICFSNDWDQDPLSKHHIMSLLSSANRILWINSIGLRTPTVSVSDAHRVVIKLISFFRGIKRINKNLWVLSPIALPYQGNVFVFINRLLLTLQIKFYCKKLAMHSPVFWTFLPNTASFVHAFKEILSIYYITDDFTKFDGHPSVAIGVMEKKLIDSCDLVIASAKKLASVKQRGEKKIHVVSHGVNHAHFAKALTVRPDHIPADIAKIPHPILGFYGELNSWIDVGMIAEAAKKRPEWSFVLIGREAVELGNINYVNLIPNIHRLGKKKFDELPFYCAAFDVALIPMKLNELTLCVNPLKLREYLASGLPVISTPLPEIEPYSDVVEFARTPDELIVAFENIRDNQSRWNKYNLSKRVINETWAQKVEEISSLVISGLKKKFPESE